MENSKIYHGAKGTLLNVVRAGVLAAVCSGCAAGLAGSGAGYDYMSRDRTNQLNPRMRAGAGALSALSFALAGMQDNREAQKRQWAHEEERKKENAARQKSYDVLTEEGRMEYVKDMKPVYRAQGLSEEDTQKTLAADLQSMMDNQMKARN